MQDADPQVSQAISKGDIDSPVFSLADRELLRFVKLITESAYQATADDSQRLRDVGWTDPQIAEAVYITALFAFFNRVADAFGLEDPGYAGPDQSERQD